MKNGRTSVLPFCLHKPWSVLESLSKISIVKVKLCYNLILTIRLVNNVL